MYLKRKHFARVYRKPDDDRGDDWTPSEDQATVDQLMGKAPEKKEEPTLAEVPKVEPKSALKEEPKAEEVKDEVKDEAKTDEVKDDGKKKDTRLPLARHQEILAKEREAREAVEAELAKYKQGTKIANVNAEIGEAETTLLDLEKQHSKLVQDGEADKAAALMSTIRKTERSIIEKSTEMRIEAAVARATEAARFDVTVERLEEQFPELNVRHEDFNKAKTGQVLELTEAYQLKGYTPSEALQKAVKWVMPPVTARQEKALETEARVDPKVVEAARKAAAAGKTAEAIEKTPANAAKVGENSDAAGGGTVTAKDIIKMPHADFIKLDENTLARARGDVI